MADLPALTLLPEQFSVCRLEPGDALPGWALQGRFFTLTRTSDELSIVCPSGLAPREVKQAGPWRAFRVEGPLDFNLVGILSGLSGILANAGISLFAISTYDTDYILVKAPDAEPAARAFVQAGYPLGEI